MLLLVTGLILVMVWVVLGLPLGPGAELGYELPAQ
jgi:aminobenzoyl-glutamate transport protein